jgi:hypothetical protein
VALEGGHSLLKIPDRLQDWVVGGDRLTIFERVNSFTELFGSNRHDNDGTQPGDCEYRNADHQQSEEYLHEALTFRKRPTIVAVDDSRLLAIRAYDHSLITATLRKASSLGQSRRGYIPLRRAAPNSTQQQVIAKGGTYSHV